MVFITHVCFHTRKQTYTHVDRQHTTTYTPIIINIAPLPSYQYTTPLPFHTLILIHSQLGQSSVMKKLTISLVFITGEIDTQVNTSVLLTLDHKQNDDLSCTQCIDLNNETCIHYLSTNTDKQCVERR